MNKRQAKKAAKKVTYPLVDEMNLLTLSPEEYKTAMKDFDEYIQKHCRYKHYKDKWKKGGIPFSYHFPVGETFKKKFEETLKTVRGYQTNTKIALESIEQIKEKYPEQMEKLKLLPCFSENHEPNIIVIGKSGNGQVTDARK